MDTLVNWDGLSCCDAPAVSVIMPVYNGARFLERSVGSVIAQKFPAWELLAVDDGSADDSFEMLRQFAARDARIRVSRAVTNRGASAARNTALRLARGRAVAYLDCDDEYYDDHLGRVDAHWDTADVLVFAYDIARPGFPGPGARHCRTWCPELVRGSLLTTNIVVPLGVAHRRSLLERVGLFDETVTFEEDWELWKRFHRAGATFAFLLERSGRYHVRPDSQARTRHVPEALREARGELPRRLDKRSASSRGAPGGWTNQGVRHGVGERAGND